jgi:hypothetical protein
MLSCADLFVCVGNRVFVKILRLAQTSHMTLRNLRTCGRGHRRQSVQQQGEGPRYSRNAHYHRTNTRVTQLTRVIMVELWRRVWVYLSGDCQLAHALKV